MPSNNSNGTRVPAHVLVTTVELTFGRANECTKDELARCAEWWYSIGADESMGDLAITALFEQYDFDPPGTHAARILSTDNKQLRTQLTYA